MTRIRILPYRQGSKGAKALAEALGGKVLKLEGSKFKPRSSDIIINWGNTSEYRPEFLNAEGFYNLPSNLKNASNKLKFFQKLKETNHELIPAFYTSKADIPNDAYPIVCRTVLAGHSGEGIVIADKPEDLVEAPLYVKYVKKQEEYRIHVGKKNGTSIISVQRKARRLSVEDADVNWKVRNLAGGFVFVREGVVPPEQVLGAAKAALEAIDLDFGAVDVIWNSHQQKAYVLEVNTAPGLEGQTIDDYKRFFTEA